MSNGRYTRTTTDGYGRERTEVTGGGVALGALAAICVLIGAWLLLNFATSFKGTDSGEVCIVKEGGPFDGRDVKEVRKPGEGPKPIGIFNDQHCLPATERDSNEVIEGTPTYPTRDSVQVVADGQVLFTLTQDPDKIKKFYRSYARRSWGGQSIWTEDGWLNFLRQRVQPIILDATRQAIGSQDCVDLNNLCQYVQNAEAVNSGDVKKVNNNQNLTAAATAIATTLKAKLRAAFGDDVFENIRYQNLRIRFEKGVQTKINNAQALRTEAANAELEAKRKVAEAKGEADKKVAQAEGARRAAFQQNKAYKANPTQADIDKIEAFCGADGCDPKVVGGGLDSVIADISK